MLHVSVSMFEICDIVPLSIDSALLLLQSECNCKTHSWLATCIAQPTQTILNILYTLYVLECVFVCVSDRER